MKNCENKGVVQRTRRNKLASAARNAAFCLTPLASFSFCVFPLLSAFLQL